MFGLEMVLVCLTFPSGFHVPFSNLPFEGLRSEDGVFLEHATILI